MRPAARCLLVLVFALATTAARAAIGTVTVVTGAATRTPKGGAPVKLTPGTAIELGDTLKADKGHLKLVLNDRSVVLVAAGSELEIDEASFAGQQRRAFSARLALGSLWAHVKKMAVGSGAKFEISTDRAVAGVRGTRFRVDVKRVGDESTTRVYVTEGEVAVRWSQPRPQVPNVASNGTPHMPDAIPSGAGAGMTADAEAAAPATPRRPPTPAAAAPVYTKSAAQPLQQAFETVEHTFREDMGVIVAGNGKWDALVGEPPPPGSFAKFVARQGD